MIKFLLFFIFFIKHLNAIENIDFIIVNKEKRNIIMYKNGKALNSFKISLGFEPIGGKVKRGDGKHLKVYTILRIKLKRALFFLL